MADNPTHGGGEGADSGSDWDVVIHHSVEGYAGMANMVAVATRPGVSADDEDLSGAIAVVFAGDVTDAEARMGSTNPWTEYSLEGIAAKVAARFAADSGFDDVDVNRVAVVRAARVLDGWASFSNFCTTLNTDGDPVEDYNGSGTAHVHLEALLHTLFGRPVRWGSRGGRLKRLASRASGSSGDESESQGGDDVEFPRRDLIICAFSKGCVVLNQLIAETPTCSPDGRGLLLSDTLAIHSLDAGLNVIRVFLSPPDTYKDALSLLAASDVAIHIHGTPYQWNPRSRRHWTLHERDSFLRSLAHGTQGRLLSEDFGSGGQARHTLHTYFDDNGMADGTLAMHFGILDVFRVRAPPAADVSGDNAAGDEAC